MKLKPYSSYKDSGVDWLGKTPSHWAVERFKISILSSRNGVWGDEALGDENDIPCVRVADFDRQRLHVMLDEPTIRNILPKDRVGRQLSLGNLLMEKSGGGENQPVGCVVLYQDSKPAVCSNFIAKVELADGMVPSFWRYMHAAAYSVRLTVGSINQTSGIQNLDQGRYFDERACFPPYQEQQAIATFLDRETAKLDTLIAKQEKLITLLQEKRQAVISHAVTKGLNPDAPMKDSGVEWLGEVPAHWEVGPVKRFYTSLDGKRIPLSAEERGTRQGSYPYYGASGVIDHVDEFLFDEGLVLVSEDGANLLNRSTPIAFVATGKYWVNNHAHILKPLDVNLLFWAEAIEALDLTPVVSGSAQPKLTAEALMNLVIAIPPSANERSAIEAFIRSESAKLDILIEKSRRSIELMREHRTALISAAVTGKIDVREAAR